MINSTTVALDPTDIEISGRITSAMLIKGIPATELAEKTGISYGTLRRSLKGSRSFSFTEFRKVATVLGVSANALLTDELAGRVPA